MGIAVGLPCVPMYRLLPVADISQDIYFIEKAFIDACFGKSKSGKFHPPKAGVQ